MSVLDPGAAESFIIRLWKGLTTNPSVRWANTYECRFTALGTMADLDSLALGLATFESMLALNSTQFLYYTISSWLPDSSPYNPDAFKTVALDMNGGIAFSSGTDLDLRICLRLNRAVPTGRIGKLFLRNSLVAAQVNNSAGTYALVGSGAIQGDVNEAATESGVDANFEDGIAQPHLALIGTSQVTRFQTNFTVGGVSFVKLNHKYFDFA